MIIVDGPVQVDRYETLVNWLEERASWVKKEVGSKPGMRYSSMYELVLVEGIRFHAAPLPPDLEPMEIQQCYWNALDLSRYCDWTGGVPSMPFIYVEGFAMWSGEIAHHHAWNSPTEKFLSGQPDVVDTTWANEAFLGYDERAYLGIPFDSDWVARNISHHRLGLIDNWQDGWPLVRDGIPQEARFR